MRNSEFKHFKNNLARVDIEESTLYVHSWFSLTVRQLNTVMGLLEQQGHTIENGKMELPNGITLGRGVIKKEMK